MKKNKFITSTIILIIGGFITKLLSMVIKIVMTRLIGPEGIGLYMLINPTFILFIAICTLGMPTAISKLVSEKNKSNKKIMLSACVIAITIDIALMVIIGLSAKTIATKLLHEPRVYKSILSIGLVLPFISISSILRGYFFGKQKMIPHVISNIIEDIVRFLCIVIFVPLYLIKGIEFAVYFLVISNIISELASIITLICFLPKNFTLNKQDLKLNSVFIKDIISISIPTTFTRIIGCISLFFEPIILTYFLTQSGNTTEFIVTEYGIINGYVMPVILLPSFFTNAISQALLPDISNYWSKGDKKMVIKRIKQAISFSLLIGLPATLIFTLVPQIPLQLLYNTNVGVNYIKFLAPICLLHYIQSPLTSALQGLKMPNKAMNGTLVGMLIKTIVLITLCLFNFKLWSLVIADSLNIIYVTIHHIIVTKKRLN